MRFVFRWCKSLLLSFIYKTNSFAKHFYIHKKQKNSILFTYGIPRALLSNKIYFPFLQIFNNSIATKLWVNLINNCRIFLEYFSALHNSMIKLCSAFLNVKRNLKNWLRKLMHSFEVHSNESVCRKSGRLGLEQV